MAYWIILFDSNMSGLAKNLYMIFFPVIGAPMGIHYAYDEYTRQRDANSKQEKHNTDTLTFCGACGFMVFLMSVLSSFAGWLIIIGIGYIWKLIT